MNKNFSIVFLALLFVACEQNILCVEHKNNQENQTENAADTHGYFRVNPVDIVDNSDYVVGSSISDEDESMDITDDIQTLGVVAEIETIEQAAQKLSAVHDKQLIEKKLHEFKTFFESLIEKSSDTLDQLKGAKDKTDADDFIIDCYEQTFTLAFHGWFYTKAALEREDYVEKEQIFKEVVSVIEAISLQTRECIIAGLAHD